MKCSCRPDFKFSIQNSHMKGIMGSVDGDGEIAWDTDVLTQALGSSEEAIQKELKEFRQR